MLKQIRIVFSAFLIATFFISTFIFSPKNTQACPVRIPSTLLSLYLQSDLIVLADFTDEEILKRENENKHGFYAQLEKDLVITKVLKGKTDSEEISFTIYEYRSKKVLSNNSRVKRFPVIFSRFGRRLTPHMTIGNQYLFFLRRNTNGKYYLVDNIDAVKNVDETLEIYEKNINELETIVNTKENQLANLTEWIVKGLEETVLRWDAIQDLYTSSNSLDYERRNPNNKVNQSPFVLDKNFRAYTSVIAKSLNDSQKARISALLSEEIQNSFYGQKPKRIDYRLTRIVRNWDKASLATNAFTILQSLDETEFEKKKLVMEFISNVIDDNKLREIYYQYTRIQAGNSPAKVKEVLLNARIRKLEEYNKQFQALLMRNFEPIAKK